MWSHTLVLLLVCLVVALSVWGAIIFKLGFGIFTDLRATRLHENMRTLHLLANTRNCIDIPVFYINLERSVVRNKNFLSQAALSHPEVRLERVTAVDWRDLADGKLPPWVIAPLIREAASAPTAIVFSHLTAIHRAHEAHLPYALICEDDACLAAAPRWPQTLLELVERCPGGWDWLLLSHLETGWFIEEAVDFDFHSSFKWSTAAYIVSRQGMAKVAAIVAHGVRLPQPHETEAVLGRWHKEIYASGELLLLFFMPMFLRLGTPLVFQSPSASTCHTLHDWLHISSADRVAHYWATLK